ncbi:MAG: DUF4339 domain-containing protein, partial [Deltaproteobacteria bacterium]|nr:DUF4339 domain-containing protein [Deltaproteobacteria bacterium]
MKFVCEHCGSKYTIADQKVRNKVLKIRCKKCDNIVKVRDPNLPSATVSPAPSKKDKPKASQSALENKFAASFRSEKKQQSKGTPGLYAAVKRSAEVLEQQETDRVQWFVAINGSPVGPISARKVHTHKQAGRVTDGSLVWKEGMADWIPLRDCKEVVGLLAHVDIEATADKKEEAPKEAPKLGLFSEEEKDRDKDKESPLKGRSVGIAADRSDAPEPEEVKKPTGKAIPSASPPSSDELLTDDDLFGDFEGGVGALHTLAPPRAASQQNRMVMLAAVGFFIVAVVTLSIAIFSGGDTPETKTTIQTVEKVIERVVYRDRPKQELAASDIEGEPGEKNNSRTQRKGPRATKKKPKSSGQEVDAKTKALMERFGVSAPGGAAPIGRTRKSSSDKASNTGSGSLSANQLKSVVNRNKNGLTSCYERALKQGAAPEDRDVKVLFKIKVGSSGMV